MRSSIGSSAKASPSGSCCTATAREPCAKPCASISAPRASSSTFEPPSPTRAATPSPSSGRASSQKRGTERTPANTTPSPIPTQRGAEFEFPIGSSLYGHSTGFHGARRVPVRPDSQVSTRFFDTQLRCSRHHLTRGTARRRAPGLRMNMLSGLARTGTAFALLCAASACTGVASAPGPADDGASAGATATGGLSGQSGGMGNAVGGAPGTGMSPTTPASGGAGGMAGPSVPPETSHPVPEAAVPYTPPEPAAAELPARVWLLTPEQYGRAVQALLGVKPDTSGIDPIPDTGVYANMSASGVVRVNQAMQYSATAEAVTTALTDAELRALVPCGKLETSCKDDFIADTVRKAFRRSRTPDDLSRYGELFELAATSGDAALPFRSVLRGVLTSPFFLYRTEIGAAADERSPRFTLTGPEVATLLAFSVTGGPPDEALLAAAERGELADVEGLKTHVETLLGR